MFSRLKVVGSSLNSIFCLVRFLSSNLYKTDELFVHSISILLLANVSFLPSCWLFICRFGLQTWLRFKSTSYKNLPVKQSLLGRSVSKSADSTPVFVRIHFSCFISLALLLD